MKVSLVDVGHLHAGKGNDWLMSGRREWSSIVEGQGLREVEVFIAGSLSRRNKGKNGEVQGEKEDYVTELE